MTTVTISIPENLKLYVEEQVKTKGFGNVSEYFRSLVRDEQKKQDERRQAKEHLEALLLEGLESEAIPVTPEFMREFRQELADRVDRARAKNEKPQKSKDA